MICPKCQNLMKTVDKNGVHIDQCEGCKGVFLDRGELEQVAAAETAYYEPAAPPPYQPEMRPRAPRMPYPDSPRGYRGGHYPDSPRPYGGGHRRGHRRRSFLEGLFD